MAIALVSQPAAFSFSGNQITFVLQSDKHLSSSGSYFSGYIQQAAPWPVGTEFIFRFGEQRTSMKAVLVADETGTTFPQGATNTVIAAYFRKNYALNSNYVITVDGDKIVFTARNKGTEYNWSASTGLHITSNGVDRTETPGFKFLFEVFLEDAEGAVFERIYSEKLNADLPFSGKLSIDIHLILDAALTSDIPDPAQVLPLRCKNSKRRYYCRYAEVLGDPASVQQVYESTIYHVATGGFSYAGALDRTAIGYLRPRIDEPKYDRFLKQYSGPLRTFYGQLEYLSFINMRPEQLVYFKTRVTYSDGDYAEQIAVSVNLEQYDKVIFASGWEQQLLGLLEPDKEPVRYTCQLVDVAETPLSEVITYNVVPADKQWLRTLMYVSSLGAFDSFLVYGKQTRDQALEQQQAESPKLIGYKLTDGTRKSYALQTQRNLTMNTGYLPERDFELLTDFYLSEEKFVYQLSRVIPISVTSKKVAEAKDGNTLQRQEFTCTLNFMDDKYTDGDLQGPPLVITPVTGLIHFGPSVEKPLTAAAVLALPESQSSDIREFILATGSNRIITIAFPSWLALHEVYNQTAEEDLTDVFLAGSFALEVSGQPYTVCTMVMTISYSISQNFKITLINV